MKLFLLRGIPGAGKSTLAEEIAEHICSADNFFVNPETGEYQFDPSRIKEAHRYCQSLCEIGMQYRKTIAVANTFSQEWEMQPYYELAARYGYMVFSLVVENRHGGQNVHDVPDEVIAKMRDRFEVKL